MEKIFANHTSDKRRLYKELGYVKNSKLNSKKNKIKLARDLKIYLSKENTK